MATGHYFADQVSNLTILLRDWKINRTSSQRNTVISVSTFLLGTIWRVLESYGHDPAEVIAPKFYRPNQQPPTTGRLSFQTYDAIVTHACKRINDPAFGLSAAMCWHPSHAGALGGALLVSSSLRTTLLRIERYSRICNDHFELEISESPGRVRAVYHMLIQPGCPDLVGDARMAILFRVCELNLGRKPTLVEVTLARPPPPDPAPWHDFFGIQVKFGQPINSLSITREDADIPLTSGDSELVSIHEKIMQRQLARIEQGNIVLRTRLSIAEQLPNGRITEDSLANKLNMSKRTLHRKLRENGETFRSLLESVRTELAEHYIADPKISVTEIAFLLGYNDISALSRAFRGWFGISPSQARARLKTT